MGSRWWSGVVALRTGVFVSSLPLCLLANDGLSKLLAGGGILPAISFSSRR